jgi:uncharacterized phage protein gp47/JayE
LTSSGYEALRAADFLTEIRDAFEARLTALGLPADVDWDRDVFLGQITAVMATVLGDVSEATQSLYDAFTVDNAEGVALDNLCLIVGVTRLAATASTVTLTLSGTPGTLIPAGSTVEGGGDDDAARWTTDADAVIGGGGTITVSATCTETGATVALIGAIDTIVTPVSGWTGVSNAAAASAGRDRETDAALRSRRQASLQISGGASANALRASLLTLDAVEAAVVVENDTDAVVVSGGLTLAPHSVAVVVYPDTLTSAEADEVAEVIYGHVPPGIYLNGADEVKTVTDLGGGSQTVRFDYATALAVTVAVVTSRDTGYEVADVDDAIVDLIADYFASLGGGDAVRRLDLFALIATVEGVNGCTLTLNGGSSDVVPTLAQVATLSGTPAVS